MPNAPVAASAECSWGVTAAARVEEELAEASALAASAGLFAGICLLATAGCTVVADGLALATVVSEWSDAGVAAGAAAELFGGVAFGAAGAGAATAAGMAAMVAKSAPVCGLALPVAGVGGVARGWLAAGLCRRGQRLPRRLSGQPAEAADATAVPAAALGSVWVCAGAAAIEEDVTDWLAAIAAAAIASGAVTGPDVAGAVGAAGTAVNVAGTGMATAIAFGAAISVASGEVAALAGSAAAEASEDDELAVDLVPSACEPADFPRECDGESVVAPAPAAEVGAALVP